VLHLWRFNVNNTHLAVSSIITYIIRVLWDLLPCDIIYIHTGKYASDFVNVDIKLLNLETKDTDNVYTWDIVENSGVFFRKVAYPSYDAPLLLRYTNFKKFVFLLALLKFRVLAQLGGSVHVSDSTCAVKVWIQVRFYTFKNGLQSVVITVRSCSVLSSYWLFLLKLLRLLKIANSFNLHFSSVTLAIS
jgi:hypothetical protein